MRVHEVVRFTRARRRIEPFANGAPHGSQHPQQGQLSAPRGHDLLGHVPRVGERHARIACIAHALNPNAFQRLDVR